MPIYTPFILRLLVLGALGAIMACASTQAPLRCPSSVALCSEKYLYDAESGLLAVERLRNWLRTHIEDQPMHWRSAILSDRRPVSPERLNRILDDLLNPQSRLNEELGMIFAKYDPGRADFWDIYFKIYDKLMPFSDGYTDIGIQADKYLPKSGRIIEYGAGSGNIAAILLATGHARRLQGIDSSTHGLQIAERKLQAIAASLRKEQTDLVADASWTQSELLATDIANASVDGGVMNNVLYTLSAEQREKLLRQIFGHLKPGANFVLNDPRDFTLYDRTHLHEFLFSVAGSALNNRAPLSEYDLAFIGGLNLQFLFHGKNKFLSSEELQALIRRVGFEVKVVATAYYGAATFLVLHKP